MQSARLRVLLLVATILVFGSNSAAQSDAEPFPIVPSTSSHAPLRVPPSLPLTALPPAPPHAFWDRENLFLFGGVGLVRALDYTSTMNMLRRGRLELLLPGDIPRNHAGFAALEAAGALTSVGLSYALHRTGHHTLERWLSIGHISVAGFGDARNYALTTYHPKK